MANGNGETRKTVAQIAKELIEQKTSIEVLKNELQSMSNVNNKIDTAITKLTDVSTSIKSMLAVHEERIGKQEDVDKAIFNLLESRRIESENKFEDLHSRLNKSVKDLREEVELIEKRLMCELKQLNVNLGERVGVLEKYRYILIGGAIIIGLWGPRIVDNGWFSWLQ
jgi:predicted RNase H-like nuclease (RuvC/YqgF family)|tara:strand:- start:1685 stop:2188 length:504 start_codon:yes stop_codon:yes gene_type:complete